MNGGISLVAAGLRTPKKARTPGAKLNRYVNYGLIGLASILRAHNYHPRVFHGHFDEPDDVAERALAFHDCTFPLLLSVPSVHAIAWASEFCSTVKAREPRSKIVLGGRWVTLDDGAWVLERIPADLVVFGEAEDRITRLLAAEAWAGIPGTDRTPGHSTRRHTEGYPTMDYRVVDGFMDLTPSVEVSRGCGRRCAFCVEADEPLWRTRRVSELASQIRNVQESYRQNTGLKLYFECSSFAASRHWAEQLARERLGVEWRTEARVDSLRANVLPALAEAGLRVVDLGLESASPLTLRRMKKTEDPARYLSAADALLRACYENGIWAKINVVMYAGETQETVAQTLGWLGERAHMIKGVSVGSLVAYRNMAMRHVAFLAELAELGARPVDPRSLERAGMAELHLSPEIDCDAARTYALDISREFMTHRDYFDLKSFGYFPRSLTFDAFEAHLAAFDEREWPFRRA